MNKRLGLSWPAAAAIWLCSAAIGGLAALITVSTCAFLLLWGGEDEVDKHGISTQQAVRIGGVLVVMYMLFNAAFQQSFLGTPILNVNTTSILITSLPFFILGLYEDMSGLLSARFRFASMMMMTIVFLVIFPQFVLMPINVKFLDMLIFNHQYLAFCFSVLGLIFLSNAFNTADGANGLVSGLSFISLMVLASIAPEDMSNLLRSAAVGCVLFLLHNLVTGRFFLGDGGAYFLGALIGLSAIMVANRTHVSPWLLAVLTFYPAADLLFSMIRRGIAGKSLFSADDGHLHNLAFREIRRHSSHNRYANSLTGVGLVAIFGVVPASLYVLDVLGAQSNAWLFVYFAMWGIYCAARATLNVKSL